MALSNVELYEALKGPIGEDAARMIAEVVPTAGELATKTDLAQLETRVVDRIDRINGRLWVMFVPLWVGLYGLIGTLIVTAR